MAAPRMRTFQVAGRFMMCAPFISSVVTRISRSCSDSRTDVNPGRDEGEWSLMLGYDCREGLSRQLKPVAAQFVLEMPR